MPFGADGGGCGGVILPQEKRRVSGGEEREREEQRKTRGCLCALGEPCKQHGGGRRGFTGRNRCLLSAPVGLLCNNRPVTLRKCGEAACVCVCLYVCLWHCFFFSFFFLTCVPACM